LSRHDSVREWYASISSVLLDALRLLGVRAETATPVGRTPLPATASCFVQPDDGEIMVDGRKLVGSALLRQQDALLQHGSILLEDDQPLLNAVLPEDELRPAPAGTLHQALAVTPSFDDVTAALFTALQAIPRVQASELDLDARLRDEAADWEAVYGSEEWTYKR
jgi:lipoate-protein ligase A